jgi:hypothetical protein
MQVRGEQGGDWSSRGNQIVFDARPAPEDRFAIWTVRPNGTGLRQVPIPLPCGGALADPTTFGCFAPAWSPDGKKIVFGVFNARTGDANIYTVDANGRHLVKVTSGDHADDLPDWGKACS